MIAPTFETVSRLLGHISPQKKSGDIHSLHSEIARYIKIGHHPILIWKELLGLSDEEMSDALKIQDRSKFRALINNEYGAYFAITAEQVLSFCMEYNLHPADLVPSVTEHELSYPHAIFRANLLILDDKSSSSEDKKKASHAVQIERKRYQDMVRPSSCPVNLFEALQRAVRSFHSEEAIDAFGDSERCYLNLAQLIIGRAFDVYDAKDAHERKSIDKIKLEHSQKRTEFIKKLRQIFYGLSCDEQTLLYAKIRANHEWTEPTLERYLHKTFISDRRHELGMEFMKAFSVKPGARFSFEFSRLAALYMEALDLQKKIKASQTSATTKLKERYGELSEWFVSGAADYLRYMVANKIYMDVRERQLQRGPRSDDFIGKLRHG